jgi:FkbM family methyltransferase
MSNLEATPLLYWRLLRLELPSGAAVRDGGEAGLAAGRRVAAVRNLFFSLLDREDATDLFEIGAHEATASRVFVQGKAGRRAHAYEASPSIFERTRQEVQEPGVHLHNRAVAAEAGMVRFLVPKEERLSQLGSMKRRTSFHMEADAIEIEAITLDGAAELADVSSSAHCGLWIDVEGAEMEVLTSGLSLLPKTEVIYIELSDDCPYEDNAHPLRVFAFLMDRGFVPICRDSQFPRTYNVLFCRNTVVDRQFDLISKFYTEQQQTQVL